MKVLTKVLGLTAKLTISLILLCIVTPSLAQLQSFGIFSPVFGIREDMPSITMPEAFTHDNENVILQYGEIHRCRMRNLFALGHTKVPGTDPNAVPDGNPILRYHYYEQSDGTDYLLAFTKDHAYKYNTVTDVWDPNFACSESCETWSTVTYNDVLYATNNIDMVQAWSGTGNFSELGSASGIDVGTTNYLTKARFLCDFEGYLMAVNVTVDGSTGPTTIYWCDTQDASTWNSGNASYLALPGPEPLRGYGKIADFLLIFSGRSIDQMWATDSTLIFNVRRLRNQMGTFSPDSIVNGANGELFFMDNRKNLRMIRSVMSDMLIVSRGIDKTVKLIPDSLVDDVRSYWVDSLEQVWWAIPYGADATTNNKLLCVDVNGAWTKRDIAISAFGQYEEKTTYTIDTIPYNTIDEIGWETIDSIEANADYRLDICGDFSGCTYNSHNSEQDAGTDFTGYAVIGTDFASRKGTSVADRFKRLVFMTLLFRNEGAGDADIYLKRDFENTWQSLGSVSLDGNTDILWQKINADYRARHFQVKVSADNPFRFIGCIFYFVPEAIR